VIGGYHKVFAPATKNSRRCAYIHPLLSHIFRACPQTTNKNECDTNVNSKSTNATTSQSSILKPPPLDLVRDGLVLLDGVRRALLVVALVGELGVVLDVRDADLGVVAIEDAGDFLESGTPVKEK
jgi:hypothetical protein